MRKRIFVVAMCLFFVLTDGVLQAIGGMLFAACGVIYAIASFLFPKRFFFADDSILEEKREEFTKKSALWIVGFCGLFCGILFLPAFSLWYNVSAVGFFALAGLYMFWEKQYK